MSKIPKNLSDKEMFKDYQEDTSLEDAFIKAEAADEKRRRRVAPPEPKVNLSIACLTPELVEKLGRTLMEQKLELAGQGITNYTIRVRRNGQDVILSPVEKKSSK